MVRQLRRSTVASIATVGTPAKLGRTMDEVEKYKRFCICCCKSLKDNYRQMKTGRLTIAGEAVVTATQLSIAGEGSLCRMCYLTVLIVQKRLRMSTPGRALYEIGFSCSRVLSSSKRASGLSSPPRPMAPISSQKEIHCH